jgi:CheY-like chemotaxis protein
MILAHSLLGGNVAEHVTLLLIGSSHAPLDAPCADSLQDFRIFQQPAKFSGLQLCESLHTLSYTSRIPIFVVSGYGAAQYKEQCEKLGARAFFQKPVNFNALKSALADEIQGKLTSPNFRSVSYPQFVMVSIENPLEPPCVDGRFDAHPSGTWKRCVEALYVIILMFQAAFDNLARAGIKHGDLLCAGVKITAYNNHRSAPFLRALVSQPQPSLLARREPTTLSDQLLRS